MDAKKCTSCGVEKPLEAFHRSSRSKDGRVSTCKECVSEYQRARYRENAQTIRRERRERERSMKVELDWYRTHHPRPDEPWKG